MYIYTINYYILFLIYLPVVNSYWQLVVNSDFAIDNRLSIATSFYLISWEQLDDFDEILCMQYY